MLSANHTPPSPHYQTAHVTTVHRRLSFPPATCSGISAVLLPSNPPSCLRTCPPRGATALFSTRYGLCPRQSRQLPGQTTATDRDLVTAQPPSPRLPPRLLPPRHGRCHGLRMVSDVLRYSREKVCFSPPPACLPPDQISHSVSSLAVLSIRKFRRCIRN